MHKLIVHMACLLIFADAVKAQSTPDIIEFRGGQITWTNVNPALYYTVEWVPTLTETNWTGSFRNLQDLQSTAPTITANVPIVLRIVGNSNATHTATLSSTTTAVEAGYYTATNLTQVDADLATGNIKAGTTIFGVAGKTEVVDTTSGDVAAGDILAGKKAWAKGVEMTGNIQTRTLSPTTAVVLEGKYTATNLTQVDTDLAAGNIKKDTVIFGITGTNEGGGSGIIYTNATAAIAKTGQTTSYRAGDDGDLERGVAWPNPRFTVQSDTNVVLDNLTGLMWARNANRSGGTMNWNDAIDYCTNLTYGGHSDWRLPNVRELQSLIAVQYVNPALPNTTGTGQWTANNPFTDVQVSSIYYWSSTTDANNTLLAWYVILQNGHASGDNKALTFSVWPVRGGQ